MSNVSGFVKRVRDIMRNDAGINGDAQRIEQIAWMLFLKVYDSKENDWEMDEDNYESIKRIFFRHSFYRFFYVMVVVGGKQSVFYAPSHNFSHRFSDKK